MIANIRDTIAGALCMLAMTCASASLTTEAIKAHKTHEASWRTAVMTIANGGQS